MLSPLVLDPDVVIGEENIEALRYKPTWGGTQVRLKAATLHDGRGRRAVHGGTVEPGQEGTHS